MCRIYRNNGAGETFLEKTSDLPPARNSLAPWTNRRLIDLALPLRFLNRRHHLPALRSGLGALLSLLVLFCGLLAGSESAHAWIHGDSDAHGDTCAVCLFAGGGVSGAEVGPLVTIAFVGAVIGTIPPAHVCLPFGCPQAPDGRAPPAGLS